jgi:hypothetical protein
MQLWGSSAGRRPRQHLPESVICHVGCARGHPLPHRAPLPGPPQGCSVPGQSVDDAKLHYRARRNEGLLSSGRSPIAPPGQSAAAPSPVRSKVAVSLGRSADDAKLLRRARRNEGQLRSGRHARWLSRPLANRSAPLASSIPMNISCRRASISPKQQRDVALKTHVASVHFKCYRCF